MDFVIKKDRTFVALIRGFEPTRYKKFKKNLFFMAEPTNEDVFFLSNGHISPVFYSTLARAGILI